MGVKTGLGATAVFSGDITLTGLRVKSISPVIQQIAELDDTALDSVGYYEKCPDDLATAESVELEVYADLKKVIPVGTVGTLTITFPLQDTQTVAATVSGTGWISRDSKPQLAAGSRLMQTLVWTFDGKTGPAFTAAT